MVLSQAEMAASSPLALCNLELLSHCCWTLHTPSAGAALLCYLTIFRVQASCRDVTGSVQRQQMQTHSLSLSWACKRLLKAAAQLMARLVGSCWQMSVCQLNSLLWHELPSAPSACHWHACWQDVPVGMRSVQRSGHWTGRTVHRACRFTEHHHECVCPCRLARCSAPWPACHVLAGNLASRSRTRTTALLLRSSSLASNHCMVPSMGTVPMVSILVN